ncbi:MAG: VWA domain-containing protein [Lentisphaeria bacterium]|nr:VWA domain-containing protein [Lentisphaeria bacterium]
MLFNHPIFLLLFLPLGAALFVWPPPTGRLRVLRAVTWVMLVLTLAGLTVKFPQAAGTFVLVADRSDSMPPGADAAITETAGIIQRELDDNQRFGLVTFGARPAIEAYPESSWSGALEKVVGSGQSDLNAALRTAVGLIPEDSTGRILVLGDGKWTGANPAEAAGAAALRNIPIDIRLLERGAAPDTAVITLSAPSQVSTGESFLIHAWVGSDLARPAICSLSRDGEVIATVKKDLAAGKTRVTFRDRLVNPGAAAYTFRVTTEEEDPMPQNNAARFIVGAAGKLPVLLVSDTPGGGLQRLLNHTATACVRRAPADCVWDLTSLADFSAVILENVRADAIGHRGMSLLADWVESTGRGLMITGGKHAYGMGGYFKSPLERIMPVSMELRQEHRKLSMAMVAVLDRSGSMAATVAGGKTKMDLANIGTVEVLDLLSDMDEYGVIAVDSAPHIILPIQPIPSARGARGKLLRMESTGGGIYVYEALKAASSMIAKSSRSTRHIILFTDAADTEQPGDYVKLLEKCRAAGITVSVIALGTERDSDAELCRDIAKRGGGNSYFTTDATQIPRLFAQDTFTVARSTFVEESSEMKYLPSLSTLTESQQFTGSFTVGGYNLCYAKPQSLTGAVSLDEFDAPFTSWWQAGAGRVLCHMGEVDGKFTGPLKNRPEYPSMLTSFVNWTTGGNSPLPDGCVLTQKIVRGICRIELHLDPDTVSGFSARPPKLSLLRTDPGGNSLVEEHRFEWSSVASLSVDIPLSGGEVVQAAAHLDSSRGPVTLPPACLPYSPEYAPGIRQTGGEALRELAAATGGVERISLKDLEETIPVTWAFVTLTPWLCALAALTFLVEIFDRRVGLGVIPAPWRKRTTGKAQMGATPKTNRRGARGAEPAAAPVQPAPGTAPSKPAPPAPSANADGGLASALKKADRRARNRLKRDH